VAEAAKVIENTQRDVNIALINELAMLFKDLGLDTREVLAAAGTKWNFHAYRPGLVGGHCIGVDPYYLTHKAQSIGFHPEMILAGRRINDGMAGFVARDIIKAMLHRKLKMMTLCWSWVSPSRRTSPTRATPVVDPCGAGSFLNVVVYDPVADRDDALHEYGIGIVPDLPDDRFQAVVLAVKHREIMAHGRDRLGALLAPGGLIYDITGVLAPGESDARI
jgi:UDP-N-acetyl-D-galactosamine dehydrogenase